MDDSPLVCPGCGANLQQGQVDGKREYSCPRCGGVVFNMAVLRQLQGTLAQQIWTADAMTPEGTPPHCPFGPHDMQAKAVAKGHAAVCRGCEAVWLDKDAYGALPGVAEAPASSLASQELRCPQCGAPVANSYAECCQYCGAGLHAPVKVVLMPMADQEGYEGHHGLRTRSVLGAFVEEAIEGRYGRLDGR